MAAEKRGQVDVSFVDPDSIVMIESHMGLRGRTTLLGLALVGLMLVVYTRALAGGFIVLDDQTIIKNMPLRSFWPGVWNIWLHPSISPHYQPLAYSLWALEFRLFNTRLPGGYLAVNVLLHAVNVLLLWTMLRRLEVSGAFVAAAIFAVHPMNVQAVGWISQQPLLLCGFFSLLAIFVRMRWSGIDPAPPDTGKLFRLPTSQGLLLILTFLLVCCALASHSVAVVLPGVMLAMVWWERAKLTHREIRAILPLMIVCLLWAMVTFIADSRRAAAMGELAKDPFWNRFFSRVGDSWGYFWHAMVPMGLSVIYRRSSVGPSMALITVGVAAAVLVIAWRMRPRFGRGPFTAAAIVALLLVPTLLFRTDLDEWTSRADQLFYLPLAVIVTGVVGWISASDRKKPKWLAGSVPIAVGSIFAVLSIIRIGDFHDPQRVWESVLRTDPDSVIALNQLGRIELEHDQNFALARDRFKQALARDPKDLRSLLNLAYSYELEGDLDRMAMRYQEALALAPDHPEVHMGLGNVLAAKGYHQQAIEEYERVLSQEPGSYQATYRLGLVYRAMGDLDRAVQTLHEALRLNPGEPAPYIDLANIAFARGQYDDARQMLEAAAGLNPTNFRIYVNVGAQLGTIAEEHPGLSMQQRGEWRSEALKYLRYAVALSPLSAEARYNLGGVLFNARKLDEAIFQLSKAVELSPNNADFRRALVLAQRAKEAQTGQ